MKNLRIHCFQQVAVEGLGCIADWIVARGHQISYTRFYEHPVLPRLDDFDCLVVMGGPMSVYDEAEYPWLADEKRLVKEAIEANKAVLGICLGAQFIAAALGAQVYPGKNTEIGWFEVHLNDEGQNSVLKGCSGKPVFHWHGDTFDIPNGAQHLALSDATPHQAFVFKRALALQFHLEVNEKSVEGMVETFRDHLVPDVYVQSAEVILSQKRNLAVNNQMMFDILDRLFVE